MTTTVLIENAFALVVIGAVFHRSRKAVILAMIVAIIAHMGFDHALLSKLNPELRAIDHQNYYILNSLFFMAAFGVFLAHVTKLSIIMAALMISQAVLCFLMSINGAYIDGFQFPDVAIINQSHEWFNNLVWGAECIVVYMAAFTGDE